MLSRVLPLRRAQAELEQRKYAQLTAAEREHYAEPLQPLKLIIMSATMRVNDFQNPRLFPIAPPPIIRVEARQYPVTTHFSKRTEVKNYLKETHKKVCQIHRKLPEGGILVFLTGKQEILYMCHKLAKSLNKRKKGDAITSAVVGTLDADDAERNSNAPKSALNIGATAAAAAADEEETVNDELLGLGASTEELMELQEAADFDQLQQHGGEGEEEEGGGGSGNNNKHRSMAQLLMQDEIEDSDNDDTEDDDEKKNESDSDISDIEDEPTAKKPVVEDPAAAKNRVASSRRAITSTGDAVRDQMLREALGQGGDADAADGGDGSKVASITGDAAVDAAPTATATAMDAAESPEPPQLRAWILPLYALMPAALQNKVFLPPPPGYRLIVVATNVAETSITIPGVRYVVDSGRQKEKVITSSAPSADAADADSSNSNKRSFEGTKIQPNNSAFGGAASSSSGDDAVAAAVGGAGAGAGIAKYEVRWVSQAAAEQRQGRAGRTGPGHCYRLYSANFFHQYLQPYQPPEITVTPLEELILQVNVGIFCSSTPS